MIDFIEADVEEARQQYRSSARGDRGAAHGRHEDRGRPVRRRQDVPAAGREERPRHEEGRGVPGALHGGGEARHRRYARAGPDRDGHGEGRRPRHRQEHRGRRARVQQLRGDRPGRDGGAGQDPAGRTRPQGRPDRAERPDHAIARRDGVGRARDGAAEAHHPAADRRRHHQPAAHGGEDRAGVQRARRARPRRVTCRRRGLEPAERHGPGGPCRNQSRRPGQAARPACEACGEAAAHAGTGAAEPPGDRLGLRGPASPIVPGPAYDRPSRSAAARAVHRLDVLLQRVAAEGAGAGDLRSPRSTGRRHASCTTTRRRCSRGSCGKDA